MNRMASKTAVITGGARGIGKACAKLFLDEGAFVVIADIYEAGAEELISLYPERAMFVQTDVSLEKNVEFAVNKAIGQWGKLDVMINNAAIAGVSGPIDSISAEGFGKTLDVLLKGVFLGMKHASQVMKKQGYGSILNMASIAGIRSCYSTHTYSLSKAAIIHLTKTTAVELGEYGVRVNSISPGPVLNTFIPRALGLTEEIASERFMKLGEIYKTLQPLKKACMPEDVAEAALWLSSEFARMITGHNLVIDGGASCGVLMNEKIEYFSKISEILKEDL